MQFKQRLSDGKKLRSLMYENDYKSEPKDLEEIGLGEAWIHSKCFPYSVSSLWYRLSSVIEICAQ